MKFGACSRADEVAMVLRNGHWPDACDAGLRSHIDSCNQCGEQVLLTRSFQQARVGAVGAAPLVSANLLWWRAQFRRRNAALEQVVKPVTMAQIFALLISVSAVVALIVLAWHGGMEGSSWLPGLGTSTSIRSDAYSFLASDSGMVLLASGLVAVALLAGAVVYLASDTR